jgi:hypothetical protein
VLDGRVPVACGGFVLGSTVVATIADEVLGGT